MTPVVSLATVGVSASVSIVTSYFGAIINFNRLRNRHRRVLGLSLLAEIKSLQRRLRRYYQRLEVARDSLLLSLPRLACAAGDTSVFNNGSGNLGLFTTRTAVEVLEYYSTVRALAEQATALGDAAAGDPSGLRDAIEDHLAAIRLARHHSRVVVIALRRDVPRTAGEMLRFGRRRLMIAVRRARRRVSGPYPFRPDRAGEGQTSGAAWPRCAPERLPVA